jgi:hypothetical protein
LAEIEPPSNDVGNFSIIYGITFFVVEGEQSVCPIGAANVDFKGSYGIQPVKFVYARKTDIDIPRVTMGSS